MRNAFRSWMSAATFLAASAVASGAVAEPADILQFQGRLLSAAGSPVPNGDYGMTLRFYAAQNDAMGDALVVYIDPAVKVDKGGFSLSVGGKTKLDATAFKDGKANWVGIQVGSDPELPRLQLHQVPYALRASTAANLACTGCVGTDHLAADVLAPYAKAADLTVFAKSDDLAKVATSGSYGDLTGTPTTPELKTCPSGETLIGYKNDGSMVCAKDQVNTYDGKNFALSDQSCAPGEVVAGIGTDGKVSCLKDANNTYNGKNFAISNQSCSAGSVVTGVDAAGKVTCAKDANNTYDGKSFATSNQSCAAGKVVTGVDAAGKVTCANDANNTYNGKNFATSNQSCGAGKVVTGVDAAGKVTCATDKDTLVDPTKFAASSQGCTAGQLVRGVDSAGKLVCVADANNTYSGANFALSNKNCSAGQVMRGVKSDGNPNCVADANNTYSGANFALSNKNCSAGQVMRGVKSDGNPNCVADANTTYSGNNFALSNKNCSAGSFMRGVKSDGNPNCVAGWASGSDLNLGGKKILNLGTPTASTNATTKAYVDSSISSSVAAAVNASAGTVVNKRAYHGIILLRSGTCPSGWTQESFNNVRGPNGWLYMTITEHGAFMGGINSAGHGHHQLYQRVHSTHGPTVVCSRKFNASTGSPHLSVFTIKSGSCPSGYSGISTNATRGNNNWTHLQANDAGFFLGHVESWSGDSHGNEEGSAVMRRWYTNSEVATTCFRVMGVDEDSTYKTGVYPVVIGVKNQSDCPSGWTYRTTSTTNGANGYLYMQTSRSSSMIGGRNDWAYGGGAYHSTHFHYTHVPGICYRYYSLTGRPTWDIRTPHTGNCPSGYTTFSATSVKGWNNRGHISSAGNSLYIGGLYGWAHTDLERGYIANWFEGEVANKLCLKMFNAQ